MFVINVKQTECGTYSVLEAVLLCFVDYFMYLHRLLIRTYGKSFSETVKFIEIGSCHCQCITHIFEKRFLDAVDIGYVWLMVQTQQQCNYFKLTKNHNMAKKYKLQNFREKHVLM